MRLRWVALIVLVVALFPAVTVDVCRELTLTAAHLVEQFANGAG